MNRLISGLFDKSRAVENNKEKAKQNNQEYLSKLRESIERKYVDEFVTLHRGNFDQLDKEIGNPDYEKTHLEKNDSNNATPYVIKHKVAIFTNNSQNEKKAHDNTVQYFSENKDAEQFWQGKRDYEKCSYVSKALNASNPSNNDHNGFKCDYDYHTATYYLSFFRRTNHS